MVHKRHQAHIYIPNKNDPHNPENYRPIALMNCILNLWTSILTIIGTQTAESEGICSDMADGFRSHRKIYDSISTHITMYEDANLLKNNIYTAYSDFKCAFGGMDHRILFQIMKEYGFHDSYINACKTTLRGIKHILHDHPRQHLPHPDQERKTPRGHPIPIPIHYIHGPPS